MPDISTSFQDPDSKIWMGWSACNSPYMRNLIIWGLPLALSQQKYNGTTESAATLSFEPWTHDFNKLPFFTPLADGWISKLAAGEGYCVRVLAGALSLKSLSVVGFGEVK